MGHEIPLARLAQHLDEPLGPVRSGHLTFDLPGIVGFGEVEVGQYPLVHRATAGGQLHHAGLGPVGGDVVRDPGVEADHRSAGGRAQEIIPETVAASADAATNDIFAGGRTDRYRWPRRSGRGTRRPVRNSYQN